jgi:hypothetical protein
MSHSPPRPHASSSMPPHYASASYPPHPSTAPAPSLRFALTSRRRAVVAHGVKPKERYDPVAVLNQRAHSARTSAPPRFQRKVQRTDPFQPKPMDQWRHEHAENQWQPVDTYPAIHNETRYKTKQCLFSKLEPIVSETYDRVMRARSA